MPVGWQQLAFACQRVDVIGECERDHVGRPDVCVKQVAFDHADRILEAQGQSRAIQLVFEAIHRGRPNQKLLAYQYLQVLPQLARDYNPRIVETLANLATQAEEMQAALRPAVEELLQGSLGRSDATGFELDCAALRAAPRHHVREVLITAWTEAGMPLQAMGFAEWDALAEMVVAEVPNKRMLPGGVIAECLETSLRIQRP